MQKLSLVKLTKKQMNPILHSSLVT